MVKWEKLESLQQKHMTKDFVSQQNPVLDSIHTLTGDAVYTALNSRPQDLSQAKAGERLRKAGPNTLRKAKGEPLFLEFLANFTHLMAILLWMGAFVALITQRTKFSGLRQLHLGCDSTKRGSNHA